MNHLFVWYVGEEERFTLIHFLIEEYKIICNNIEYKILKFNMSDRKMK